MNKNIINGPYLLDPHDTQITVAWETVASEPFKVTARAADGTEFLGMCAAGRRNPVVNIPRELFCIRR